MKYINFIKKCAVFLLEIIFYDDFNFNKSINSIRDTKIWHKFNKTHYLFNYKDKNISDLIWQMKFKNNRKVAEFFGKILADSLKSLIGDVKGFILIPIPIHTKRRSERGFNQCERLCEEIIKSVKINYGPNILIRDKHTVKQSWSSKKDRLENLEDVFKINKKTISEISGKKIILLDDVITTGSTIKEARQTLLESGASLVISICIAH